MRNFDIRTYTSSFTPNVLAESQPDPTPDELHKASKFTGLMENMKVLYDDHYVSATKVKSVDKFWHMI